MLYILALASQNKPIDYENIFSKKLHKIKDDFVKLGYSKELFMGWDDGHLRNAIAHAHFTFDEKQKKMNFKDIEPWSNKIRYNQSFSLQEFAHKTKMIDAVSHIFTGYIILLRVLDLTKHKWIRQKN